jgi:hypothetical protein
LGRKRTQAAGRKTDLGGTTGGTAIARTGPNYLSINAGCLDDVDIFALKVKRGDGRTHMPGGDLPPLADG